MKHFLTHNQIIGAIVLVALVVAVNVFVRMVPQHALSPQMLPDSLIASSSLPSDTLILRSFDPNTADSLTLLHLGLKPWQIHNMMLYRAKNGRYRTPEDFHRLYGLTDSAFHTLRPYIAIDTLPFYEERLARQLRDSLRRDSIRAHYQALRDSTHRADSLWRDSLVGTRPRHEKRDTVLELNAADTSSLQFIRGIGRYTAVRIIKYRRELGGFASVGQLQDSEMQLPHALADSILLHFTVCPDSIRPIRVNRASVEQLRKHPYINYRQADAIYTLRRRLLRLKSVTELEQLDCFSFHEIQRLTPYLDFSE